jgi:hypothetical protein
MLAATGQKTLDGDWMRTHNFRHRPANCGLRHDTAVQASTGPLPGRHRPV